jgi:hypothetical protein
VKQTLEIENDGCPRLQRRPIGRGLGFLERSMTQTIEAICTDGVLKHAAE